MVIEPALGVDAAADANGPVRVPIEMASPDVEAVPSTAGYRFWLVPHTHWDREWYLPFEEFRIRLVRTVDEIIDVLETDPSFRCFVLDGQAVILEDYLEIRPQQAFRLRRLVQAGRIAVGPSYILPDEYLVGAESLVRNLLMGRQVCERHGAIAMHAGYMPDTFGHVEQLPQILRGFGIDTFIFWRGLGDEADELGPLFRWRGPDGSEVLAVRQLGSYGNADEFGRWGRNGASFKDQPGMWPEIAALRFTRFLEMFGPVMERSGVRDALLCNGSDHKPIMRDLPTLLQAARVAHPAAAAGIVTYDEFVARLRRNLAASGRDEKSLPLREGELCGGKDANVLRGVNSARLELKQANESAERALFVAETLASLAALRAAAGRPTADAGLGVASPIRPYAYPLDELRHAWRELLRNQPHDSISGCSVDAVHRDMWPRYAAVEQIAGRIRREALAALAGRTESWYPKFEAPEARQSIVNVLPWRRHGTVELPLPPSLVAARSIVAEVGGAPAPVQIEGPKGERRAVVAAELPGFGATDVALRRPRRGEAAAAVAASHGARRVDGRTIENERYRVSALPDGSLEVVDLRYGDSWRGLHRFEDVGDRGDEYTFDPVAGDIAWTSDGAARAARVRVTAAGPAIAELTIDVVAELPASLTSDRLGRSRRRVRYPIRTVVHLAAGVERIDFRTTFVNRAEDHRLRVAFAAPDSAPAVRAEGHFGLVRRPALPVWDGTWFEPPAQTHHTSCAVAAGRLTLFGKGLPEYQAVLRPGGGVDLALTLVRSVGWLSRGDLAARADDAGPSLPTPEAQGPGERTVEYAIDFDGARDDASILRASQEFRVGLTDGPAGADTAGLLSIDGDGFAFGGLKGAEDGAGTIVRLYAGSDAAATVRIAGTFAAAEQCRLDETPVGDREGRAGPRELPDGTAFTVSEAEVASFRLRHASK